MCIRDSFSPRRAYTRPVFNPDGLDISFWARARGPAVGRLASHHISGPDQPCQALQFPQRF
eukprot:8099464-Alexandrium_andersonii.AAC.1